MSEPLDPITQQRLRDTETQKARVRMIDLPAVAQDIRLGTLHPRARLPVVRQQPPAQCAQCGRGFWPRSTTQIYCEDECRQKAKLAQRRTGPVPKVPIDIRADRVLAVSAVCATWVGVSPGDIASPRRSWFIVRPRLAAYALCQMLRPDVSKSDIARAFNRDHTSILNGLRVHVKYMLEPEYAARFEAAKELVRPELPA